MAHQTLSLRAAAWAGDDVTAPLEAQRAMLHEKAEPTLTGVLSECACPRLLLRGACAVPLAQSARPPERCSPLWHAAARGWARHAHVATHVLHIV